MLAQAKDYTGARRRFEQSLVIRQRLAAANPSSSQAQIDLLASLVYLLELPGGEPYWTQARALADTLRARALLGPQEQRLLDSIRQHTPKGR